MQSRPLGAQLLLQFVTKPVEAECFPKLRATLCKHLDARKLIFELACQRHKSQPFPAVVLQEAEAALKEVLISRGVQLDLDAVPERPPCKLALLEEFLRLCDDPDFAAFYSSDASFAKGVSLGVRGVPRTPAIFEGNCKWRSYDGETEAEAAFRCTYPGAQAIVRQF